MMLEKVGDQRHEILDPLAQGRDPHRDDVQSVIEILSEAAFGDEGFEVAVGGGDRADVDRHRSRGAQRVHLPFLQHRRSFD